MNISVVIAGEKAPANAFVVWRGYESSINKAAKYGYDGIELALGSFNDISEHELKQLLDKNGITVSCISTGLIFARDNLYLSAQDHEIRTKAVNAVMGLIHLAERHGQLITMGRVCGFIEPNTKRTQTEELLAQSLSVLDREAERSGVRLAIEPINRYESNFLNTISQASVFISCNAFRRVGILADLFHMNIEEDDPIRSLSVYADQIYHVHIADSNRKAPGMGHTDFKGAINALQVSGYKGWLSAEILPGDNPDEMAKAAIQFMRNIERV